MPPSNKHDDNDLGLDALLVLPVQPARIVDIHSGQAPIPTNKTETPSQLPASTQPVLSEAELRYLSAVIENPGRPSSAYAALAGMSPKRAMILRKDLLARGYLRQHVMATGQRGREAFVLEPTDAAREVLAQYEAPKGTS